MNDEMIMSLKATNGILNVFLIELRFPAKQRLAY